MNHEIREIKTKSLIEIVNLRKSLIASVKEVLVMSLSGKQVSIDMNYFRLKKSV